MRIAWHTLCRRKEPPKRRRQLELQKEMCDMQLCERKSFVLSVMMMSFMVLSSVAGIAGNITVSWDANTEGDLAGYNIYIGENPGNYTGVVDLGNLTQFTWNNLEPGKTYYFAVTAYDVARNESDFSQEVNATLNDSNNPPELVAISVLGETQLDISFSEPLQKSSAEDVSNYSISNGVSVLGAVLDQNATVVHLVTSPHERGRSYTLSISNIEDLSGARIAAGSSKNYTMPDGGSDTTPPELNNVTVVDLTHIEVTFNEKVNGSSAERESNYEIDNGVQILKARLSDNKTVVNITTTAHQNGQTHVLKVSNVTDLAGNKIASNSSINYNVNVNERDETPPELVSVVVNGATQIDVNFSEPVVKSSAENKSNYSVNSGVQVVGAILGNSGSTVHLITSAHDKNQNYTLTVNNIKDRAENPNTIASNAAISYDFSGSDDFADNRNVGITPQTFALFQNYPNPFNPETEIRFYLDQQRGVELSVYNPLGQLVKTLLSDRLPSGFHTLIWDGTNNDDIQVPSGVYIYSLEVKREAEKGGLLVDVSIERRVKKMTLIR
ncbi:MAG: T9SS type A sorting domain-containing protein [Caldithrix sp.]|nr:MAG: T9SS type A sorting domain-containing protein [Caldithrix sp.]